MCAVRLVADLSQERWEDALMHADCFRAKWEKRKKLLLRWRCLDLTENTEHLLFDFV